MSVIEITHRHHLRSETWHPTPITDHRSL